MSTKVVATVPATEPKPVKKVKTTTKVAPVAEPEPVVVQTLEVEVPEVEAPVEEPAAPRKKLTVAKGSVTVTARKATSPRKSTKASPRSPRVASKSPKAPPKTASTRKTPAKKTTSKSPVQSPTSSKKTTTKPAAKKVGGARVATKGKAKVAAKATKRRPVNVKPAPIDFSGIGIGPAKVKKVLMHHAFNEKEHEVRQNILKAENRPVKPKPTAEVPDPAMPEQGPQVSIDKLPKATLDVIRAAERAHQQALNSEYEHHVVSQMSDADKKAYQEARKKASESADFDLRSFNVARNKKFYAGFDAWCKENDSYALGRVVKDKKGVERERFNQWSRAMALVNKSCLRLSNGVRDILACYLDNLVIQYARNGIVNCVAEDHSNLQLRHALTPSDGFDERVPMDAFARTLDGYQLALNWIESCRQTREEIRDTRRRIKAGEIEGDSVSADLPDYPDPAYDENFEGYVVDTCRSVRMQMAESQKTAAEKEKYHNIKVSENFKRFCSIIIYESVLRIGAHLKEVVKLKDVKTVNAEIMHHTLKQVSNLCGIPFDPIKRDMTTRLDKFRAWCLERRDARRAKRKEAADADAVDEDDEEEEEDDVEDEPVNAADDDDVVAGDGDEEEVDEEDEEEEAEEEVDVEYE